MTGLLATLETYSGIPAPSGRESELAGLVRQSWQHGGEVRSDRLGNLSRTIGDGSPHIALVAHLDEIGVVVRRITEDGFVGLDRLGGVPERVLIQQRMVLLGRDGPVEGVVGTHPHHYTPDSTKYRVPTIDDMYVDVGASSAEEVTRTLGVRVGDFGAYARAFSVSGDRVLCNALDDRSGLAALTAVLGELKPSPPAAAVSLIASVQEEFSVRSLLPTIRALQPDVIIVVDVSPATDTPDMTGNHSDVRLGAGPVVHLHSFHGRGTLAGVLPPVWLVDAVERAADAAAAPLQRASFFGGITDGAYAQLEHDGIPTVEVGIPVRYTHSPAEMCALPDLRALVEVLVALCRSGLREEVR